MQGKGKTTFNKIAHPVFYREKLFLVAGRGDGACFSEGAAKPSSTLADVFYRCCSPKKKKTKGDVGFACGKRFYGSGGY
jgi:hypothetical protein